MNEHRHHRRKHDDRFEDIEAELHDIAMSSLPHNGSVVETKLRGPSSQILELQGKGQSHITWEPIDRRALELEVRMKLVESDVATTHIPLIYWDARLGHGAATWTLPSPVTGTLKAAANQGNALPVRGTVMRTSARMLRLTFQSPGDEAGTVLAKQKLLVSFQPVLSGCRPDVYPRENYVRKDLPAPVLGVSLFPAEAHEFRIRNPINGLPFALGVLTITIVSFAGSSISGTDASLFADWTPIPFGAQAHTTLLGPGNYQVEYQ